MTVQTKVLSNEEILKVAPSVFAENPNQKVSDKYRFLPTIKVVDALRDMGYGVVRAEQSRSLQPGQREFARHMLRFRHASNMQIANVGDEIPELVLTNSHNGLTTYNLMLGIFRLACSNGMIVMSDQLESLRIRHTGSKDLLQNVIDVTGRIIEEAPKAIEQIHRFKQIVLTPDEQLAFGSAAREIYPSSIALEPREMLWSHRSADGNSSQDRSLWQTSNSIQENMIRGGMSGRTTKGGRTSTRAIKSVQNDIDINKALWKLTEELAKIKENSR